MERVVAGHDGALLVSSLTDPSNSNFIFMWPMWRKGDIVWVQNHVLFLDEIVGGFEPEQPHLHLPARETVSADGERVSEWTTSVRALAAFLRGERVG